MRVIRPGEHTTNPTIFLAGPIQNAPDWQSVAIEYLGKLMEEAGIEDVDIASPRMWKKPSEFVYDEQVAWESKYLAHSAETGVILFWLANPDPNTPLDPTRGYAQTTRFELAEWFGKCHTIDNCISLGIEPGFHGMRYINKRFIEDLNIDVFHTLKQTCENAIRML